MLPPFSIRITAKVREEVPLLSNISRSTRPAWLESASDTSWTFVFPSEENILLPMLLDGKKKKDVLPQAEALMERVGILKRRNHTPKELSGGEQQRNAIVRVLINQPAVLFADEPIGNLDSKSRKEVLELLRDINQEKGISILMVTHSEESTRYGSRIVRLRDGEIML